MIVVGFAAGLVEFSADNGWFCDGNAVDFCCSHLAKFGADMG